jgi:hypothetical protein
MKLFRKLVFAAIDVLMIFVIIRPFFIDDGISDYTGLGQLIAIGFFIIYNLYGWVVYSLFAQIRQKHVWVEVAYFLLMLFPFFALWRW